MTVINYDRAAAVNYAEKWAYGRNPAYFDFEKIGGDCTNFASQCIFAGAGIMNETPVSGWYYRSSSDRTASWTGVAFLYRFLTENNGVGPFATETDLGKVEIGDMIQLGDAAGTYYHSPVVVGFSRGDILVAAHSFDTYNRPLSSYAFERVRGIHILGVRK